MPITVCIPAGSEAYNSVTDEIFSVDKDCYIVLEHSLVSLHKWEQKWHDAFLDKRLTKTPEQILHYLHCMTLTKNVDPRLYYLIPKSEGERIKKYIEDPMTATKLSINERHTRTEIKTAEVIYSDMIQLGIPYECRKWHLNSLLMLIQTCAEKQKPEKQMSRSAILSQNRALNKARRAKWNSKG